MARLLQQTILSMSVNSSSSSSRSSSHRLPGLSFGESNGSPSSPGLSFPLGTGLVVLIILLVSGVFSFCYHWLSLRKYASSISPSSSDSSHATAGDDDDCIKPPSKLTAVQCPPVVYMAGEEMPRFIAVPCPLIKPGAEDAEKKELGDVTVIDALKLDIRL